MEDTISVFDLLAVVFCQTILKCVIGLFSLEISSCNIRMADFISFDLLAIVLYKWITGFHSAYPKRLRFLACQIQSIWAKANSNEKAMKNVPIQQLQLNEEKGDVAMQSWEETEMGMGKMENIISFFGLLAGVSSKTIVKWVIGFRIFYSKLLCFFPSQIQSIWAKSNSNEKATENVPTQQSQLNEAKGDVAMLSWEETEMVMGKMGIVCCPKAKKQKIVQCLGGREFSALFEEAEPSLEEVEEAFAVFDENRDGFIDAEELQRVQCNLGFREAMELEACERMIGAFDTNGDGRIDFMEFVKLLESSFG